MSKIEIDKQSGCCFGVAKAISKAEEELKKGGTLYCLGDIVHNNVEVERLAKMGLITINHEEFKQLKNVRVLLRAHGEPPSTYQIAKENNIELIDASCPVVLGLQKRIKKKFITKQDEEGQIVIFGKKGHAEVNGLMGQTDETAIVIEKKEDIEKLDFSRDISLFSQTTKPLDGFQEIGELIKSRMKEGATFEFYDTICRQVSNRVPNMHEFAKKHDLVIFIAGEKSSNGKVLFAECKKHNENSYLIHDPDQINPEWIRDDISIGICGATSTPMWQMEAVAKKIKELIPETEVEKAAF
ncbi:MULTISPECIES: 4-hydroxy-3-methylbut-2-enyl diphosphate reductase [Petrimonas]|jgi:4-hydroxy-3-methylbut-2-enyl diphosphate reductase|uniref:4-hydroxy-3-methylbut-2-enyl diphosphate reductase n=1 Tax=Petrimonas mucosa TaxID=1642646 RepID=A0A1G4G5U2_9BACT|nr:MULTISPECIES: 4-hydroxy-3-methylbut-2-enyl diphosphate reductase [Petrimonas]MDD3560288.1 4-hydroxy-3-methylbut-2-enyl diphosphate reductase [Petrimonas mucosa]SCM56792.1 4-hydroxy-3-methylbut-2-enyl diphosphate reductase {ECO:0000255/HAMAP-Rule:MF_00191} [Petrimonas mucosa]SFU38063.1 4-hydroxy-3-methylbut-2-enyl diphosphate reductase [Porphyromonadaceae bacterium KHP3R9]HHT30695.1 4-hydroxy-3-methylbut-2-enyl diphosphate reductase [Petrimonas mucosa]